MKKTFFRIFAAMLLPVFMPQGWAQDGKAIIIRGEKATFYILAGAYMAQDCNFSPDGKYVGGNFTPTSGAATAGFIYDFEKDTTLITYAAKYILSPNWFAGGYTIFKDGKLMDIESRYTGSLQGEYKKADVWGASSDMTRLVTMGHEETINPATGSKISPNYPYIVEGNTGKIIQRVEPHWPMSSDPAIGNAGYGARANTCNEDATILVGHSYMPKAGDAWSPVFWDLNNDTSFFVGDETYKTGSIYACNRTGTIMGGNLSGKGAFLVYYNPTDRTWRREDLTFSPGKSFGFVQDISDNNLALFIQEDATIRQSYIYNLKDKTSILLEDYVKELYGLEMPIPSQTTLQISPDGRKICGWSIHNRAWVPYVILLDEQQIFAKPRFFSAIQQSNDASVRLKWSDPLKGQYTLKGYNVFCDSVQLNSQLIDKEEMQYTYTEPLASGIHAFTVQAVYEEGVSSYHEPVKLMITAQPGCIPIQEISSILTYNRMVDIYWGLPSAQISQQSKNQPYDENDEGHINISSMVLDGQKLSAEKTYRNMNIDMFRCESFNTTGQSCALVIGDRLLVGNYKKNSIDIYNLPDMQLMETYVVDGVSSVNNMVYVNGKIYVASVREEIVVLDPSTMQQVNRLKTESGVIVRHLSYIPDLDGGKGGFAYGDWRSLNFCNRYGQKIDAGASINIDGLVISATAYYDGCLYILSQSGESKCELYAVDFASGNLIAKKVFAEDKRLAGISSSGFVAGGMGLSVMPDSTIALTSILQFPRDFTRVAFLEIAGSPYILGYNLYRNGEKINDTPIQGLHYADELIQAGTYTYTIETVNKNECTSMMEDIKTEVIIRPTGECVAPAVKAFESNHSVCLDWSVSGETSVSLVGFNIYRNGEQMADKLLDLQYIDYKIEPGTYQYVVEAFYENSCVASDTVDIKVTHHGSMMPPTHIVLTDTQRNNTFDVTARWELPYFEAPLPLGYGNIPRSGIALSNGDPIYAAIAWDSAVLDPYKDLYVVGIEYFIGESITNVEGFVYLNDTMVCLKETDTRIVENAWNTLMFGEYFSMNQFIEVAVGYKVYYSDKTKPVAVYDFGPENSYANLYSMDGKNWRNLITNNITGNWCINALVVKKRDMENSKKTASSWAENVKMMSLSPLGLTEPKSVTVSKESSESIRLTGFNVYRNGTKLNSQVLKDFSFTDVNVSPGSYEYMVSAVYGNGDEAESEALVIDLQRVSNADFQQDALTVWPNPASSYIRVQGDFIVLDILDIKGTMVRKIKENISEISLSDFVPGVYMLHFTLCGGKTVSKKLVIK